MNVAENGGPIDSSRAGLYWSAPQQYLGKKLGSYGGTMSYIIQYRGETRGRGDSIEGSPPPALLTGIRPHVILQVTVLIIMLFVFRNNYKFST